LHSDGPVGAIDDLFVDIHEFDLGKLFGIQTLLFECSIQHNFLDVSVHILLEFPSAHSGLFVSCMQVEVLQAALEDIAISSLDCCVTTQVFERRDELVVLQTVCCIFLGESLHDVGARHQLLPLLFGFLALWIHVNNIPLVRAELISQAAVEDLIVVIADLSWFPAAYV